MVDEHRSSGGRQKSCSSETTHSILSIGDKRESAFVNVLTQEVEAKQGKSRLKKAVRARLNAHREEHECSNEVKRLGKQSVKDFDFLHPNKAKTSKISNSQKSYAQILSKSGQETVADDGCDNVKATFQSFLSGLSTTSKYVGCKLVHALEHRLIDFSQIDSVDMLSARLGEISDDEILYRIRYRVKL